MIFYLKAVAEAVRKGSFARGLRGKVQVSPALAVEVEEALAVVEGVRVPLGVGEGDTLPEGELLGTYTAAGATMAKGAL